MADTPNISMTGGIRPTNGGGSNRNFYSKQQDAKKEKKAAKLRVGEIVRGRISDRIDEEMAFVQIPTGTFKAIVANNLKKDDSILFKVIEVEPDLILKVNEVSTGSKENPANAKSIIRMLDIADDDFHVALVDSLILNRSNIIRDDVLELYKAYVLIKESTKKVPLNQILTMLIEVQNSRLPLSKNLMLKLLPLFMSENLIGESLNYIAKNLDQLPFELSNSIEEYLVDIKENNYKKNNVFLLKQDKGKSFFELLDDVEQISSEQDLGKMLFHVSRLRELIASMSLWNLISFTGKTSLHYIIPYYFEQNYFVIRITQRKITKGKQEPVSFSFSVPSENIGEIKNKVLAFQNQLKVYMQAENSRIVDSLEKYQNDLTESLTKKDFDLESLNIGLSEIKDELSEISKLGSGQNFTIVV